MTSREIHELAGLIAANLLREFRAMGFFETIGIERAIARNEPHDEEGARISSAVDAAMARLRLKAAKPKPPRREKPTKPLR